MIERLLKEFKKWITLKVEIHTHHISPFFHKGDIWWCAIGLNIGSEIDGKNNLFERPVYILRTCGPNMFIGLPLTTKKKELRPYYCEFNFHGEQRIAILSQVRVMSGKRLIRRIGKVGTEQMALIEGYFVKYITYNGNGPLAGSSGA